MTNLRDLPRSRGKICMHGLLDTLIAPWPPQIVLASGISQASHVTLAFQRNSSISSESLVD
jgi:hypothetical protein